MMGTNEIINIRERLFSLKDDSFADFQSRLTPNVERDSMIGVRVPELRKLAGGLKKEGKIKLKPGSFIMALPHKYYDENMLHGLMISELEDYEECIKAVDSFLPYVDNWAVCDIMSPKIFKKHRAELIGKIREWSASGHTYTCRFGIGMLMSHFLDGDFSKEYLEIPAGVHSKEYYVNMMIAWFYATALAKQWNAVIPYIENKALNDWTHNKTIQKACESRRITDEQKAYLRSLKTSQKNRL